MKAKVLIFGSGSIGQRHIKALKTLRIKEIAIYKTNKGTIKQLPSEILEDLTIFYDENEALNWNPTHIIISNPTSLHLEYILKSTKTNASIFVEKPVIDDLNKIDEKILNILLSSKIVVGYNLRFHSLIKFVKNKIDNKDYGRVLKSELKVGHYLPFWHPYEDYRNSYAAKRESGGGAIRTLSHEIDLANYFFGKTNKVFAKVNRISDLEIDVDDDCIINLEMKICNNVNLELDFLNPVPLRRGNILFEKGLLEYDYFAQEAYFTSYSKREKVIIFESKEDYNLQYFNQMEEFITNKINFMCNIKDGLFVDKIISLCELSNKTGEAICLD